MKCHCRITSYNAEKWFELKQISSSSDSATKLSCYTCHLSSIDRGMIKLGMIKEVNKYED